jgi:hypothetical protein
MSDEKEAPAQQQGPLMMVTAPAQKGKKLIKADFVSVAAEKTANHQKTKKDILSEVKNPQDRQMLTKLAAAEKTPENENKFVKELRNIDPNISESEARRKYAELRALFLDIFKDIAVKESQTNFNNNNRAAGREALVWACEAAKESATLRNKDPKEEVKKTIKLVGDGVKDKEAFLMDVVSLKLLSGEEAMGLGLEEWESLRHSQIENMQECAKRFFEDDLDELEEFHKKLEEKGNEKEIRGELEHSEAYSNLKKKAGEKDAKTALDMMMDKKSREEILKFLGKNTALHGCLAAKLLDKFVPVKNESYVPPKLRGGMEKPL